MVGNGLNRCIADVQWSTILDTFARRRGIDRESNSYIPFPLEFERLMNYYLSKGNLKNRSAAYSRAKGSIAKEIKKITLPEDAIHYKLRELKVDSIITTNYDFLIENAIGIKDPTEYCKGKRSYINGCTSKLNNMTIFHPHGVISNPSTMCLGYINYAKIVKDLEKTIAHKRKNRKESILILEHCRNKEHLNHWATKFYDSDVAFIGFGLDDSEMDFWWLLAHRASLMNQQVADAADLINNTIVFYDIVTPVSLSRGNKESIADYIERQARAEITDRSKKQKYKLLESMNIFVKTVETSGTDPTDFINAYAIILQDLQVNGIVADRHNI